MAAGDGDSKAKPSPLRSIIAGSTAGAVEIAITYPAEFAKTRVQLNRRLPSAQKVPWPPFGAQWYAGCTTLIIGNSLKAGIRFVAFDFYKSLLTSSDATSISGPRTVIAGFGAGVTESLLAVTPFESIKTQLIADRKLPNPQYRGFLHGTSSILRTQGPRALTRGFVPTTMRQASNSAVRFSAYTSLKQLAEAYVKPGERLGGAATFGIGALAGLVTVAVTQPLDTVKTRIQGGEGMGKGVVKTVASLWKEEGLKAFWSGSVPRAARLVISGGVTFTMYEKVMEGLHRLDPEKRYI